MTDSLKTLISIKGFVLVIVGTMPALGLILDGYSSAAWYLLGLMGIFAFILRAKAGHPLKPNPAALTSLLTLFLFLSVTTLVYVSIDDSDFAKSRLERHLLLLIVVPVFYLFLSLRIQAAELLQFFALSGFIYFAYAMTNSQGRLDGVVHAVHFGNVALVVMIFGIAAAFLSRGKAKKVLSILGTIGAATAFVDAGSRGGLVALAISTLTVAMLLAAIHKRIRYAFITVTFLCVASFVAVTLVAPLEQRYEATISEFESTSTGHMLNSIGMRFLMWDAAWERIQDNWLLGGGFSAYREEIQSRIDSGELDPIMELFASEPHNQFLYRTASHGIVGLVTYLLIFVIPMVYLLRRYKNAKKPDRVLCITFLVFIVAFMSFGLTITLFDQRRILQFFGLVYAVLALYLHTEIKESALEDSCHRNSTN